MTLLKIRRYKFATVRAAARSVAFALLGALVVAAPARATWIEGKVFCDDGDQMFDAGDDPIDGVEVKAVGDIGTCKDLTGDTTAGSAPCPVGTVTAMPGYYRIMLPHTDDTYIVMLTGVGLPPGSDVLLPASGQYSVVIDSGTGDPSNARKTRNFLLHDCPHDTTSTTHVTSTTHTTSTSSTSTTHSTTTTSTASTATTSSSSTTSSTSTSTTSTTPTTTPIPVCVDVLDHLKCYRTRRNTSFTTHAVHLKDQFEDVDMTVHRPYRLCNPVDKEDEGINDPTEHQMCYQIRDKTPRFARRNVKVENQFGTQFLVVGRPESLCVPAEKDGIPSDLNGDRMKCYRVSSRDFVPLNVNLEDQFETKDTTVLKPILLCNPTEVNGDPINDPVCHQVCYRIDDLPGQPDFVPVPVTVEDEFHNDLSVNVRRFRGECRQVSLLCVPSLKTELP